MKKTIVAALVFIMVLAVCATSFATPFTRTVQCVNENDYVRSPISDEKQWDDHRIYVHCNALDCSNRYTNHFRGYEASGDFYCGNKWVTPNLDIPIQGSGFCDGWCYYLTMRGNTKYFNNEGHSRIRLSGWFVVDY